MINGTAKLVSIISPCFNVERYIGRFLDSIINQTYPNIEVILINDGSTDQTGQIIESYKDKIERKGYKFILINQANAGQSAAINQGLKVFVGEYMTWLDSDDALTPFAIEKKVDYFTRNPNVGLVVSRVEMVSDETFSHIGFQMRNKPVSDDNLFYDLIAGNNVFYTPGGYMVRSSMFRKAMPKNLQIEAPRENGQNFQLLLPIIYKYPYGYIDDVTYIYTVRPASYSHVKYAFEDMMHALDVQKRVLYNIANNIEKNETRCSDIKTAIDIRISKAKLWVLYNYHRSDHLDEIISLLKEKGEYNKNLRKVSLKIRFPILRCLISIKTEVIGWFMAAN